MYTFHRYRTWLDNRSNWSIPGQTPEPPDSEPADSRPASPALPAFLSAPKPAKPEKPTTAQPHPPAHGQPSSTRIEIEPVESEFGKILKRPGE